MVTKNDILKFALAKTVFTRRELLNNLGIASTQNKKGVLSEQLNRLVKSGKLIRVEEGVYKSPEKTSNDFSVLCTEEMVKINQLVKNHFPFINYCLWSTSSLIPFTHHIPKINLLFLEVEREVTESVFNLLINTINTRVFLKPSPTDFERYVNTSNAVIIRPLITESPLQYNGEIPTPSIEKIIVDIIGDMEFSFLQGMEINYVLTTIFDNYNINKKKLLRYAARRARKKQVTELINANKL